MRLLFIVLASLSFGPLQAQDAGHNPRHFSTTFALINTVPMGGMRQAIQNRMGNMGFGVALNGYINPWALVRNPRPSALWFGGGFAYSYLGRDLSSLSNSNVRADYKTTYQLLQIDLMARLRPAEPLPALPFIEVFAGGCFYNSTLQENLTVLQTGLGQEPFVYGDFNSGTFNRGLAVGVQTTPARPGAPGFSLRLAYNMGGRINYVVRNSLVLNNDNRLQFATGETRARTISLQVGVTF